MGRQFLVRSHNLQHHLTLRTLVYDNVDLQRSRDENGLAVFEIGEDDVVLELIVRRRRPVAAAKNNHNSKSDKSGEDKNDVVDIDGKEYDPELAITAAAVAAVKEDRQSKANNSNKRPVESIDLCAVDEDENKNTIAEQGCNSDNNDNLRYHFVPPSKKPKSSSTLDLSENSASRVVTLDDYTPSNENNHPSKNKSSSNGGASNNNYVNEGDPSKNKNSSIGFSYGKSISSTYLNEGCDPSENKNSSTGLSSSGKNVSSTFSQLNQTGAGKSDDSNNDNSSYNQAVWYGKAILHSNNRTTKEKKQRRTRDYIRYQNNLPKNSPIQKKKKKQQQRDAEITTLRLNYTLELLSGGRGRGNDEMIGRGRGNDVMMGRGRGRGRGNGGSICHVDNNHVPGTDVVGRGRGIRVSVCRFDDSNVTGTNVVTAGRGLMNMNRNYYHVNSMNYYTTDNNVTGMRGGGGIDTGGNKIQKTSDVSEKVVPIFQEGNTPTMEEAHDDGIWIHHHRHCSAVSQEVVKIFQKGNTPTMEAHDDNNSLNHHHHGRPLRQEINCNQEKHSSLRENTRREEIQDCNNNMHNTVGGDRVLTVLNHRYYKQPNASLENNDDTTTITHNRTTENVTKNCNDDYEKSKEEEHTTAIPQSFESFAKETLNHLHEHIPPNLNDEEKSLILKGFFQGWRDGFQRRCNTTAGTNAVPNNTVVPLVIPRELVPEALDTEFISKFMARQKTSRLGGVNNNDDQHHQPNTDFVLESYCQTCEDEGVKSKKKKDLSQSSSNPRDVGITQSVIEQKQHEDEPHPTQGYVGIHDSSLMNSKTDDSKRASQLDDSFSVSYDGNKKDLSSQSSSSPRDEEITQTVTKEKQEDEQPNCIADAVQGSVSTNRSSSQSSQQDKGITQSETKEKQEDEQPPQGFVSNNDSSSLNTKSNDCLKPSSSHDDSSSDMDISHSSSQGDEEITQTVTEEKQEEDQPTCAADDVQGFVSCNNDSSSPDSTTDSSNPSSLLDESSSVSSNEAEFLRKAWLAIAPMYETGAWDRSTDSNRASADRDSAYRDSAAYG